MNTLEQQLRDLSLPLPDAFTSRVLAHSAAPLAVHRRRGPRVRTLIAGVGAGILFVGANVAAAEYVPGYPQLAQVLPFMDSETAEKAKQEAGIPDDDFVPLADSVTVDDVTVRIGGVYADAFRTSVIVQIERVTTPGEASAAHPLVPGVETELVAADGYRYQLMGASGSPAMRGWASELKFGPLRESDAGDEMTLILRDPWSHAVPTDPPPTEGAAGYMGSPPDRHVIPGEWRFAFVVIPTDAPALPLPGEPITVGDTRFALTAIRLSGYRVLVEYEATGGGADRLAAFAEAHPDPDGPDLEEFVALDHDFWPWLVDGSGVTVWEGRGSVPRSAQGPEIPEGICPCRVVDGVTTFYGAQVLTAPGPGTYTIRFGRFNEGLPDFSSSGPGWPITIPD